MNTIKRKNPTTMPRPVGEYSHVTVVPKHSTLYTFSGQIGIDSDGLIPDNHNKQIKHTFQNIKKALESEGLDHSNVIKVNVWSVDEIDWDFFYDIWHGFFNYDNPSMTIAYVKALGLPEISIEIEILAAKPD